MSTILDTIAAYARERVAKDRETVSFEAMRELAMQGSPAGGKAFYDAIAKPGMRFICEVKKASPSKGVIDPVFDYISIARSYDAAGADAVSCLTEPKWFLGSDSIFRDIRAEIAAPMLRKDFVVDEYQLCLARLSGEPEARPVLPRKTPPKRVPLNVLRIFSGSRVYMKQRREALLKGMYVFALSESAPGQALNTLGLPDAECEYRGEAKHVFTHRIWEMRLWAVHIPEIPPALEKNFYTLSQLDSLPIPTAMRAARAYVQKELTE